MALNDWKKLSGPAFEEVRPVPSHCYHHAPPPQKKKHAEPLTRYHTPHPPHFFFIQFTQIEVGVFVCATTGNGDAPENAEKFWRFIKRRTQPKTLLSKMQYAVLVRGRPVGVRWLIG